MKLCNRGLSVVVLEARDRVGGRIRTFLPPDGGPPAELGAQVVHGDANPLWKLLGELGPVSAHRQATPRVLLSGKLLHIGVLTRLGIPPWALESRLPAVDEPVQASLSEWGASAGPPGVAAEWFRQNWAADPGDLSAAGLLAARAADRSGTGEYDVEGGLRTIVDKLAAGLDIRTGTPVRELTFGPGGVTAHTSSGAFTAGRAVITVPPPVITSGRLAIPGLPDRKLAAAGRLPLGDGCCAVVTLSAPAPDSSLVFDATGGAGFVRCLRGRPEVVVVAKGPAAVRARAALAEPAGVSGLLADALPWTAGAAVTGIELADWGADEWIGGSFTYPAVGSAGAAAAWAEPVGGTLYFAGEAAAPGPASVQGAMASGAEAANRIMEEL